MPATYNARFTWRNYNGEMALNVTIVRMIGAIGRKKTTDMIVQNVIGRFMLALHTVPWC
jgi:hypothetical protein